MRFFFFSIFLFLVPYSTGHAQQVSTPEEAIGRIIKLGLFEGHDQKLIAGMGDAAAIVVTKVVGDSKLTPGQIDSILLILNSAFVGVGAGQQREPRTALFVLRHLELSTKDTELLKRIEHTRAFVLEQVTTSKQRIGTKMNWATPDARSEQNLFSCSKRALTFVWTVNCPSEHYSSSVSNQTSTLRVYRRKG